METNKNREVIDKLISGIELYTKLLSNYHLFNNDLQPKWLDRNTEIKAMVLKRLTERLIKELNK